MFPNLDIRLQVVWHVRDLLAPISLDGVELGDMWRTPKPHELDVSSFSLGNSNDKEHDQFSDQVKAVDGFKPWIGLTKKDLPTVLSASSIDSAFKPNWDEVNPSFAIAHWQKTASRISGSRDYSDTSPPVFTQIVQEFLNR